MSQQPPWQTMPREPPPAGYRPLLQQPYGRPPYAPQRPGPAKRRLPPIAWAGIGVAVLLMVLIGSATSGGGTAATATPRGTATARAATATATPKASATVATATRGTTQTPGAKATPAPAAAALVVTVKENSVNVRQSADANAPVIATLDPGTDAAVLGPDTTGPDGATRWVHVRAGDKDGYVRSDLVSAPHVPAAASAQGAPPTGVDHDARRASKGEARRSEYSWA